jgi:hypothetical protein
LASGGSGQENLWKKPSAPLRIMEYTKPRNWYSQAVSHPNAQQTYHHSLYEKEERNMTTE